VLIADAIHYREAMVNRARQIVGDAAEDVVQDIFEYLIKARMPTSPNPERVLMWYVKNRSIQHLRARKRYGAAKSGAYLAGQENKRIEIHQARFNPPEPDLEKPDKIDRMLEALAEVDPIARELFILIHCDGWTLKDISRQTGIKTHRLQWIYKRIKIIINEKAGDQKDAEQEACASQKENRTEKGCSQKKQ
jgi:RNA polymerase sigma factor (sigma-70 family)